MKQEYYLRIKEYIYEKSILSSKLSLYRFFYKNKQISLMDKLIFLRMTVYVTTSSFSKISFTISSIVTTPNAFSKASSAIEKIGSIAS